VGFSVSNDISSSAASLTVRKTRVIMFLVGVSVLIASFFFPPNVFWLMLFVGTVFASSWGPVALMSIWSNRITAKAAFWGMATGFVFNVVPAAIEYFGYVDWPSYANPALLGAVVSLITILILSYLGNVTREERLYRLRLHRTPEAELSDKQLKITLLAPFCLIIYGCVMPFLLINFYVRPYQTGAGLLQSDGGLNWATGEVYLTLAYPIIYIALGILGLILVRRRYSATTRTISVLVSNDSSLLGQAD